MDEFGLIVMLLFIVLYLIAWFLTMQIVVEAAADKGYWHLSGKLWFIGLFGLIFTPPIIVAALPDKKAQASISSAPKIEEEFPSI